jgi:formate dehydrogenase major subunit
MDTHVKIIIDGKETTASPEETILQAANRIGIDIPTMCYMQGKTRLESCGVCMVAIEGSDNLLPACASRVQPGMVVHTDTKSVKDARKLALQLLLSDHVGDCNAPCELACPASIDIPGFLRAISKSNPQKAHQIIMESIAFPGVLGRICPKFCELVCRRGKMDEPVSICALKRYPADVNMASEPYIPQVDPPTGKSVAIIGAGLVGLTAAYFLLRKGHCCTLYEAGPQPGGALRGIIPQFRLPAEIVDTEIDVIKRMGAEIICNSELGSDFSLDSLLKKHDAVLLATGTQLETLPEFPGSEHAQSSLQLLKQTAKGNPPSLGKRVVVIGSNRIALDACRTVVRLGAKETTLAMHLARDGSVLLKTRIEDTQSEGINIIEKVKPLGITKSDSGTFECRFSSDDGEITIPADTVFISGKLTIDSNLLESEGLEITERGVKIDRKTNTTSIKGVFAAGNVVRSSSRFAIHSSASAQSTALAIHHYLDNTSPIPVKPINVHMHSLSERDKSILFKDSSAKLRISCEKSEVTKSGLPFAECDLGLAPNKAISEAARCLDCDCAAKNNCVLRDLSTEHEAKSSVFKGECCSFERDTSHDSVVYESGKCVKCGRCIAVAEEQGAQLGLTYIGRGFQVRVGVPLDESLKNGLDKVALKCADACPTGALSRKR